MNLNNGIEFGQDTRYMDLVKVGQSIKTYSEQIEDEVLIKKIRQEISAAETIVFLGFGFHPQNMSLLTTTQRTKVKNIYATAKGFSSSDREVIAGQIANLLRQAKDRRACQIDDLSCEKLLSEHQRALTLS